MLGHGLHPLKAQHRWSIQTCQPVHFEGRTPIRGPGSVPIDTPTFEPRPYLLGSNKSEAISQGNAHDAALQQGLVALMSGAIEWVMDGFVAAHYIIRCREWGGWG